MIDRSKHNVPPENRVGSEDNYIVSSKSRVIRQGLKDYMPESLHLPDFSRHNPTRKIDYQDVSTLNMLSVPTLEVDELRLGMFLFDYALKRQELNLVFCLDDEDFRTQKLGDGSKIYINKPGSSKHFCELMPFISLSGTLKKNKVRMENYFFMPMLQKLESFGILTLTEINHIHCVKPDTPEFNTNCVLIELNPGFTTAPINRKWLK